MSNPTVSLVLTIHNRTPEVSKAVADSFRLPGNQVDEAIIVMDRATEDAWEGIHVYSDIAPRVHFERIDGEAEWKCPALAWNKGYAAATGDYLYCISSEVVQESGNVHKARQLADPDTIVFGACYNSKPTNLVVGAEPGLLVSSKMPRPLGFIAVVPRRRMVMVGGNDLSFMGGLWYEDDDLYYRLWKGGADFLFVDTIRGTHLDHERPSLATPDGQAKIARNQTIMAQKHGSPNVWATLPRMVTTGLGVTRWSHI